MEMSEAEQSQKDILGVLSETIPYKDRSPRLKSPKSFPGSRRDMFEAFYSDLINDWIPNQPDREALMKLFIMLGFNATAFVGVLIKGPDFLVTHAKEL